jgi:hypothetical protein
VVHGTPFGVHRFKDSLEGVKTKEKIELSAKSTYEQLLRIYTITMPGQFGHNPDFNVGITTQDWHEPLDVNITVFSDKFSKSFFETCEPGVPKLATLNVSFKF